MKVDAYMKTMLTAITVCLLYLCLRDFVHLPTANADTDQIVRVVLVDATGTPIVSPDFRSGEYVGPVLHVASQVSHLPGKKQ
jgi:hypothetical protein